MASTSKSSTNKGEASCDSYMELSHDLFHHEMLHTRLFGLACVVRPEWAAMLAALAFGGGLPS